MSLSLPHVQLGEPLVIEANHPSERILKAFMEQQSEKTLNDLLVLLSNSGYAKYKHFEVNPSYLKMINLETLTPEQIREQFTRDQSIIEELLKHA